MSNWNYTNKNSKGQPRLKETSRIQIVGFYTFIVAMAIAATLAVIR